jgi:uncharacterized protein (UPF0333 family)
MKKGQAAVEYLVLTGFTMLFLMILLVASYTRMSASEKQIDMNSAEKAVNRMKEAVDFVYIHGHPTKLTISVYLPKDIDPDNSFIANSTINLAMRSASTHTDVWRPTLSDAAWDAYGDSSFPSSEGYYNFIVESTPYDHFAGLVNIHR